MEKGEIRDLVRRARTYQNLLREVRVADTPNSLARRVGTHHLAARYFLLLAAEYGDVDVEVRLGFKGDLWVRVVGVRAHEAQGSQ